MLRRDIIEARMRPVRVVPVKVISNVVARCAHAVVGFEINAFVLDAAPQAFDKDVGVSSQLHLLATLRVDVSG